MSGQIKVEKDLFYEIRAVACYLCNYDFSDGEQPWPLFEKRIDEQGNMSNGLCEVLAAMLDTDIVEPAAHSTVLCDKCNASLLEYEHLENKLREIRNEIKSNYTHTMQCILNQNALAPAAGILKSEFTQVTALYAPEPVDNTESDVSFRPVALSGTDAGVADNNFADNIQEVKVEESELLIDAMPGITDNQEYNAQQSIVSSQHDVHEFIDDRSTTQNHMFVNCMLCIKSFLTQHDLDEHTLKAHANEAEYKCSACDCRFFNNTSLRLHERTHQKCSSKFLDTHKNTRTTHRPFKCNECGKEFSTKYRLQAHVKIHSERQRPYACDECDKTFLTEQNLKQHKQVHSGFMSITCNVCSKSFSTPHNLSLHMIVHTNVKPFVCKTCGKSFARRVDLKDHERIHSGERPFKCDLCPMAFAQRSNLNSHKKSIHLNEQLHTCQECNKSFKQQHRLDYHMHSVHKGLRPHKCDMCDAAFVYTKHYKKHMLMHSVKKPFECVECGAGFMRKPLLLAHMQQTKHGGGRVSVEQPHCHVSAHNLGHINTNKVESGDEHFVDDDAVDNLLDSV